MADVPVGVHMPRHANSMPSPSTAYSVAPQPPPTQPLPKLPYPEENLIPVGLPPTNTTKYPSAIPSALLHGGAHRPHSYSLNSKLPSMMPAPLNYRPSPKSWESAAQREAAAIQRPATTQVADCVGPANAAAMTAVALMNGGRRKMSEPRIEDETESPILGRFTKFGSGAEIARTGTPSTMVTNEHGAVMDQPAMHAKNAGPPVEVAPLTQEPQQLTINTKAGRVRAVSDVGSAFGVGANPWTSPAAVSSPPSKPKLCRKQTTKVARVALARDLEEHIRALAQPVPPMPPMPQGAVELPAYESAPAAPDSPSLSDSEEEGTTTNDERVMALLDLYFSTPDEHVKPKLVRSITKSIKKRARSSSDERSQLASLVAQLRSPITEDEPQSATSDYSESRLEQWEDSLLPTAHPDGLVPNPLTVKGAPVGGLASPTWTDPFSSQESQRSNRPKLSLKTTPSKLKPTTRSRNVPPPIPSLQPGIVREDTLQRQYAQFRAGYSGEAPQKQNASIARKRTPEPAAVSRKATPEPAAISRNPTPGPAAISRGPSPLQQVEQFKPRPRRPSYEGHGWYDEGEWIDSAMPGASQPSPIAKPHANADLHPSASLHQPMQHIASLHREVSPAAQRERPAAPRSASAPQVNDPPAGVCELPSLEPVARPQDEQELRNARRREWEAARDAARAAEDDEIRAEIAAAKAAAADERMVAKRERKASQQARQERAHAAHLQLEAAEEQLMSQAQLLAESDRRGSSGGGRFKNAQGEEELRMHIVPAALTLNHTGLASPPLDARGRLYEEGPASPPLSNSSGSSAPYPRRAASPGAAYMRMQRKASPLSISRVEQRGMPTPPTSGGSTPAVVPIFQHMESDDEADYAPSQYGGSDPGAVRGRDVNPYARLAKIAGSERNAAPNPYRREQAAARLAPPNQLRPAGHVRSRSAGPQVKDPATIEREIAIAKNKIEMARAEMRQKDEADARKNRRTARGLSKLAFGSTTVGKILS